MTDRLLRFDDEYQDYVAPVIKKMQDGDYNAARQVLADLPEEVREKVRLTVAARTAILL